jgi:hypothetical protein
MRAPARSRSPSARSPRGAASAVAGDTVNVAAGTYREQVTLPSSGTPNLPITFHGAPGARVLGTDSVDSFTLEPGSTSKYSAAFAPASASAQVFVDGVRLSGPVASAAAVVANSFYFDNSGDRLYVDLGGANPNAHSVEASARSYGFLVSGKTDLVIDGFEVSGQNTNAIRLQTVSRVEGYSNFLWIALISGLHRLGLDLVVSARVLSAVSAALCVLAVASFPHGRSFAVRLLGVGLLASLGPVAVWVVGGLEQPLLLCLVAWALWCLARDRPSPARIRGAAVLLGLASLTRPDGIVFAASAAAALLLSADGSLRERLRDLAIVAGIPALLLAVHTAFRIAYYGDYVPNSARVKVALNLDRLLEGLTYLGSGLLTAAPFVAASITFGFFAWRSRERHRMVLLTGATALLWSAYVALVGGDIFPGYRHLGPTFLALVLLVVGSVDGKTERLAGPRRLLAPAAWAACLTGVVVLQWGAAENRRAISERWEYQGESIARALKRGFARGSPPLLAASPPPAAFRSGPSSRRSTPSA